LLQRANNIPVTRIDYTVKSVW